MGSSDMVYLSDEDLVECFNGGIRELQQRLDLNIDMIELSADVFNHFFLRCWPELIYSTTINQSIDDNHMDRNVKMLNNIIEAWFKDNEAKDMDAKKTYIYKSLLCKLNIHMPEGVYTNPHAFPGLTFYEPIEPINRKQYVFKAILSEDFYKQIISKDMQRAPWFALPADNNKYKTYKKDVCKWIQYLANIDKDEKETKWTLLEWNYLKKMFEIDIWICIGNEIEKLLNIDWVAVEINHYRNVLNNAVIGYEAVKLMKKHVKTLEMMTIEERRMKQSFYDEYIIDKMPFIIDELIKQTEPYLSSIKRRIIQLGFENLGVQIKKVAIGVGSLNGVIDEWLIKLKNYGRINIDDIMDELYYLMRDMLTRQEAFHLEKNKGHSGVVFLIENNYELNFKKISYDAGLLDDKKRTEVKQLLNLHEKLCTDLPISRYILYTIRSTFK